ncbi:flagellar motor switch phosphatase FliY [Anaerotruncus colihominis]|uniref:flagellar motor switch phosphatase FliY n=1 Tax=Anaerotruncus colihominis TaxID=169435 RepID=UPI00189FA0B3|nr:flagellar motor switch phosphatase FliY [Anaerotruncus colihominis]
MSEELLQKEVSVPSISMMEQDAIGEVLNISMGSSATAVSSLLDRQVNISTPSVSVREFHTLDYSAMEPALIVKIEYVEGISGNNVMVFRQRDIQIILNLLMGNDDPPSDDFEFDELSMSAACEVMNQMMGAAATALSEFLNRVVNISTPTASVVTSEDSYRDAIGVQEGDEIVAVSFHIDIQDVMNSDFVSILTCSLAKEIVEQIMGNNQESLENIHAPAQPPAAVAAQEQSATSPQSAMQPPAAAAAPQPPVTQAAPPQPAMQQPAPAAMDMTAQQQAMQQVGMQPAYGMPPYGQMPYGYPMYPMPPYPQQAYGMQEPQPATQKPINVQNTQFPQFTVQQTDSPTSNANMDLLMGVSLDVSVEIGQTKRKIKDIIDFGQGTVIELNKQAGAPVDIVVNGRLLARGDVVVIDDNFGVRITEIVGTKELMESLKEDAV